jgi:hypothetical protein
VKEFHADGLRVDGVASMLYLDYSRKDGEWVPNQQGERDNLEAVAFLREMNEVVYGEHPGTILVASRCSSQLSYAPRAPRPRDLLTKVGRRLAEPHLFWWRDLTLERELLPPERRQAEAGQPSDR